MEKYQLIAIFNITEYWKFLFQLKNEISYFLGYEAREFGILYFIRPVLTPFIPVPTF